MWRTNGSNFLVAHYNVHYDVNIVTCWYLRYHSLCTHRTGPCFPTAPTKAPYSTPVHFECFQLLGFISFFAVSLYCSGVSEHFSVFIFECTYRLTNFTKKGNIPTYKRSDVMGGNYVLVRDVITMAAPNWNCWWMNIYYEVKKTHILNFILFYLSFSAKIQYFHSKYLFCRPKRPHPPHSSYVPGSDKPESQVADDRARRGSVTFTS